MAHSLVRFALWGVVSFSPVHFSTWSLFISHHHRVGPSIETSALFIGSSQRSDGTAARLHRRLSPVCEKGLCLYLRLVRAADIRALPSPHHYPISALVDSSRQRRSGGSSSVDDLPEGCRLREMSPKPPARVSTSSDSVLDTFNKGSSALIATVLVKVMTHSVA